ncbi:MAG: hypothetical protein LBS32_02940 [Clostridiales Family XIII bacterium]|jgi:hypothetical protein|nr:hypothetical protein [Clostridiales Family XIII bacterium]
MNRKIMNRAVCAAVSLLLLSAGAFAVPAFAVDAEVEAGATAEETATDAEVTAAADPLKTGSITGKVTKVEKGEDSISVTIDDGKDGYVLHLGEQRFVYDQKAKDYAGPEDIAEGIQITAFLPKDAPSMLSMPPQVSAVFGVLLNSDAGTATLGYFDEELLSSDVAIS